MSVPLQLYAALFAAKKDICDPKKNKKGYGYAYADLTEILSVVDPVCEENGLLLLHYISPEGPEINKRTEYNSSLSSEDQKKVKKVGVNVEEIKYVCNYLVTMLIHIESGESISSYYRIDTALADQDMGSEITYGRRYCIQSLFGLSAVDDDGKRSTDSQRNYKNTSRPAATLPPAKKPEPAKEKLSNKELFVRVYDDVFSDNRDAIKEVQAKIKRNLKMAETQSFADLPDAKFLTVLKELWLISLEENLPSDIDDELSTDIFRQAEDAFTDAQNKGFPSGFFANKTTDFMTQIAEAAANG